jgi:hypothetical protein
VVLARVEDDVVDVQHLAGRERVHRLEGARAVARREDPHRATARRPVLAEHDGVGTRSDTERRQHRKAAIRQPARGEERVAGGAREDAAPIRRHETAVGQLGERAHLVTQQPAREPRSLRRAPERIAGQRRDALPGRAAVARPQDREVPRRVQRAVGLDEQGASARGVLDAQPRRLGQSVTSSPRRSMYVCSQSSSVSSA